MNKYLVTGGAGFIGSHTVDQLLAQEQRVVVLDNFSSGNRENIPDSHPLLEIVEGDIKHSAATVNTLEKALNVKASHTLEDGLRELLNSSVKVS